jgi:hypothetical protein
MFNPIYYYENTIHSNIVIEITNTIHNILTIYTNNVHYLYWRQFIPIF